MPTTDWTTEAPLSITVTDAKGRKHEYALNVLAKK